MKTFLSFICILFCSTVFAQQTRTEQPVSKINDQPKVRVAIFDGIITGGYVDGGGYVNFTGPNINLKYKSSKFILGMLPSLRFKQDESKPTKNSLVTPNLGCGLTYSYKNIAIQVSSYYNAKTSIKNGTWVIGIGIGYSFKR